MNIGFTVYLVTTRGSVSKVAAGYGLEIRVRLLGLEVILLLAIIFRPSCPMDVEDSFPGGKAATV
jgi:hypothetical protein